MRLSIMLMKIQEINRVQEAMLTCNCKVIWVGHDPNKPEALRDVKNEDRSDYVYENTGKSTKCILQKCPFLHESAPNERQSGG